jgi:hypothetical protein
VADDATEAIVYDESVRAIDQQQAIVESLSARAGTLLALAALATTFLGERALTGGRGLSGLAWAALGAFFAVSVLTIVVLLPFEWKFALSARVLIEDHLEVPERNDAAKLRRFLALRHERNWDGNFKKLTRLFWCFRLACVFLTLEVLLWTIDIGRT